MDSPKARVNKVLKSVAANVPVVYGHTKQTMPYILFNVVSNVGTRLSDKRHHQVTTWQIDVYNTIPLDIVSNQLLTDIQNGLESEYFMTTEWMEIPNVNEKDEITAWRYMLEVVVDV